ncbi:GNAT family N-acetyltransferase [Streptomyces antimicrobicus]|uniref:N-acetyltransferase n=1 Tax=Streptomyces antimicrobicus TaxID=2883108 RepID=A0ABS8B7Z3_9ACTN|nr:GNAT family N-acetyltransferase [Streptomyces antimicrobicus]MCB5180722.1 N-acetyltransferase [Streptomyces antimicrobicus]
MAIEIHDLREAGRLEAREEGELVGSLAYFVLAAAPHALVAVHTVVEPGQEGRGIGGQLVARFYETAAEEQVPVVPLCPYAAAWAARHPDRAPAADPATVTAATAELEADPRRW